MKDKPAMEPVTCGQNNCECGWPDSTCEYCVVCLIREIRDNSWRDSDDY